MGLGNKTQPSVTWLKFGLQLPRQLAQATSIHTRCIKRIWQMPAAFSESFVRTNIRLSSYSIWLCTLSSSLYTFFLTLSSSPAACTSWMKDTDKLEEASWQKQQVCPSTNPPSCSGPDESCGFPRPFGMLPDCCTWELQEFCLGHHLHLCPDCGQSCPSAELLQENAFGKDTQRGPACMQRATFNTLSYKLTPALFTPTHYLITPHAFARLHGICTFPTLAAY